MFIHEYPSWPDFTWDTAVISDMERKALLDLGFLAGRFADIGFDNKLAAEVETVTNNVTATFEIEGMSLNVDGVRSSVARKFGYQLSDPAPYNHFVEGIVDMMLEATQDYNTEISDEKLFKWHRRLFPQDTDLTIGKWRNDEMSVVSGTLGRERIHYRAPSAESVPEEMKRFIEWFNSSPNTIIKAAIAHFWFVCIHPFDDGNGRIARALADRVMASITGERNQFYSLNRQILRKKDSYYKVLERVSRGEGDITEWLSWFIKAVENSIFDSSSMLSQVLNKATFWRTHSQARISERQKNVLNRYLDGYDAKLTAKNWQKIAAISKDTALRDIASLEAQGILKATPGRVRDVSYSIIINGENPKVLFENIKLEPMNDGTFIHASLGDNQLIDKLMTTDITRYENGELTLQDLAFKYFAFML